MRTTELLPASLLWLRLAAAQCFNLDGSQVAQEAVACNQTPGAVSQCCAANRNGARDVCLANGLCQAIVADTAGNQRAVFARESCTRPDWVGCLRNVCPGVTGGDAALTACAPTNQTTQWCCGENNQACCRAWPNHPDAANIPLAFNPNSAGVETAPPVSFFTITGSPTGPVGQPTSFVATQTAAFPTDNPGAFPTDTGSGIGGGDPGSAGQPVAGDDGSGLVTTPPASGLSTQAIAGIAAGVVVVVVVLVTVGCFMAENWYKKRNRIYQVERRGSLKNKIRLGFDRDSPERARQIM